jgi:pimeloyl-ACP methyl ester carboxylesterase
MKTLVARIRAVAASLLAVLLIVLAYPAPAQEPVGGKKGSTEECVYRMDHISIKVTGTAGSPVILIPGLSSPRAVWDGVAPALAKIHTVYLVQVNGFGGDAPGANLRPGILTGMVADLDQWIRSRKLTQVAVVGHSMGGIAGLLLAARHPADVDRLMVVDELPFAAVMLAPPGIKVTASMVEPRAAQMRDATAAAYGKPADLSALESSVAHLSLNPANRATMKDWAMAADPRVTAQALYENLTTDVRPELGAVQARMTVVYAWNTTYPLKERVDPFFRKEYAAVQKVTYVGVGPSGHMVMLDQPEQFQEAMKHFLEN